MAVSTAAFEKAVVTPFVMVTAAESPSASLRTRPEQKNLLPSAQSPLPRSASSASFFQRFSASAPIMPMRGA